MTTGQMIKNRRENKNITQSELAELIGCDQTYLSRIENDERIPSDKYKVIISKVLDLDIYDLFYKSLYDSMTFSNMDEVIDKELDNTEISDYEIEI